MELLPLRDIASISRVSRGIRVSAEPCLYRTISLDWVKPPLSRILTLFRAIRKRPYLITYIKHLSLVPSRVEDFGEELVRPGAASYPIDTMLLRLYSDVQEYAVRIVEEARFPDPGKWIETLRAGDAYAYTAIFLSQLAELRSLRLDHSFVWQSGFPGLMMRHALFSAPEGVLARFEKLEVVDYGSNVPPLEAEDFESLGDFPACDPEQFMAWFYLPSLKVLEIWLRDLDGMNITRDQQEKPWNLENVHTLGLVRATASYKSMQYVLSRTRSLKSLHLGLAYSCIQGLTVLRDVGYILEGLTCVRKTVEKLTLTMDLYPDGLDHTNTREDGDVAIQEAFRGVFKLFPKLRSAEIPITHLLGWWDDEDHGLHDLLPSTLQDICLRNDHTFVSESDGFLPNILDSIGRFLSHCKTVTPLLRRIAIRLRDTGCLVDDMEENRIDLGEMRVACARKGISLNIFPDRDLPGWWTEMGALQEGST